MTANGGELVVSYCLMTKADVSVREAAYVCKGEGRCTSSDCGWSARCDTVFSGVCLLEIDFRVSGLEHLEFHSTIRET